MTSDISIYSKIEIELTSHCNLACPGCSRTHNGEVVSGLELASIPHNVFVETFTPTVLKNKIIAFCGVYGDPLMHKDFFEITKYCLESKTNVVVDTNASLRSTNWWQQFGELGKKYGGNLFVRFSVDGHKKTNHLYRVKSNFDKILTNMKSYTSSGGKGQWKYIVFPHNKHEIDTARQQAKSMGLDFILKPNTRIPDQSWPTKEIIENKTNVTKKVHEITNKNNDQQTPVVRQQVHAILNQKKLKTRQKQKSIDCEWLTKPSLFVGFDGRVWPCCYFQNSYHDFYLRPNQSELSSSTGRYLHSLDKQYGPNWNNINYKSLNDVLKYPLFVSELKQSIKKNPHHTCEFNCTTYI